MRARLLKKLRKKYYGHYIILHPSHEEYIIYRYNKQIGWRCTGIEASSNKEISVTLMKLIDNDVLMDIHKRIRNREFNIFQISYPF